MEIQDLLPRSRQTAIFPYPEPDKSTRRSPIPFKIYLNIILYIPRSSMPPVSLSFPHHIPVCIYNIQQYKS